MPNRSISKVLKTIVYIYMVYHKKESSFLSLWVATIGCFEDRRGVSYSWLSWGSRQLVFTSQSDEIVFSIQYNARVRVFRI